MKDAVFTILSAIVGCVAIVAIVAFLMPRPQRERRIQQREPGFQDVVKSPKMWDQFNHSRAEAAAAAEQAKTWDDQQVNEAAHAFIFDVSDSREAWRESRILSALGERTQAAVISILSDADHYARLVKPTRTNILPEAPFNRACDLLGDVPPAAAVAAAAPFLADPSDEIRKDAALVIGRTGDSAIVPHVRKALQDSDDYVRSYALMGLQFAHKRDGLADQCVIELFEDVKNLLAEGKNADQAADLLFAFDSNQAIEYFLSDSVISPDSSIIHEVLETLANAKVTVPRDTLLTLIAQLEAEVLEYPKTYALGEALRLLGQHKLPMDRKQIEDHMTHRDETVAEKASDGLLCSYGLDAFMERIWELEEKAGVVALSLPQRYCRAVYICDGQVNNGGFSQYFFNSSGDDWKDALAGFEAIGSLDKLNALGNAISLFGESGPSADRRQRQIQLSRIVDSGVVVFDSYESAYYDSTEIVPVLLTRYVLANPGGFR